MSSVQFKFNPMPMVWGGRQEDVKRYLRCLGRYPAACSKACLYFIGGNREQ